MEPGFERGHPLTEIAQILERLHGRLEHGGPLGIDPDGPFPHGHDLFPHPGPLGVGLAHLYPHPGQLVDQGEVLQILFAIHARTVPVAVGCHYSTVQRTR